MRWLFLIAAGPLLLLCGCDWGHHVQFQIRPRPDDLEVVDALRAAAAAARYVRPDEVPPEKARLSENPPEWEYAVFVLGSYVSSEADPPQRPVWFGGWATDDAVFVDLDEFNRGWPWSPSRYFRQAERHLTAALRQRFGRRVRVVKKAEDMARIPWLRRPP